MNHGEFVFGGANTGNQAVNILLTAGSSNLLSYDRLWRRRGNFERYGRSLWF
jgi:hypothetical protein